MGVLVVVAAFVVTNQADINGGEEREDEGLNKAHENFQQSRDGRDDIRGNAAKRVDQVFAAEDVAVKSERKGDEAERDRDDFDAADAQEDKTEHDPHREAELLLVGLIAEEVEDQHLEARVAQHEISPSDERDDRQRKGGIKVGGRRADRVDPVAMHVVFNGTHSGEQAAPVHQKNKNEEAAEGREDLADHAFPDDRLEGITQSGSHAFDEGLAPARNNLRGTNEDANGDDDHRRQNPRGEDRVGNRDAA